MNLSRFMIVLALLLGIAVVASVPVAAVERPGPGAFLKYRVDSVGGLIDEINREPRVAELYTQHFGVSREHFTEYLQKNVHLITLRRATHAVVYFTAKNGGVGHETRVLPAGTKVFATEQGDLVVEWRCGNPLGGHLPMVMSKALEPTSAGSHPTATAQAVAQAQPAPAATAPAAAPSTAPTVVAQAPPVETTNVLGSAETATSMPNPTVSVLPSVETLPPVVTAPVVPAVAPAIETATATAPVTAGPTISGGSKGFPWIIPAILGAGAGIAGAGGGGSHNQTQQSVPEPTSIVFLATGLVGYGLRFRSRKS